MGDSSSASKTANACCMNTKEAARRVLVLEDLKRPREWLVEQCMQAFGPATQVDAAVNLAQARDLVQTHTYALALVDWELPDGNASALIAWLSLRRPDTITVVATIHDDDERVFAALRSGARGYLLKSQRNDLVQAQLRGIDVGQPPLSPAIALKVLDFFRQPQDAALVSAPAVAAASQEQLGARESEVLGLIAKGYKNAEVAEKLGLTCSTIGTYVRDIYRKLGISSRAQAALAADRLGLVDPSADE